VEVLAEIPAELPVELPTEVPAEVAAEVPAEIPAEVPAEIPAEVLSEDSAEVHEESGNSVEIPEAIVETIPTEMTEDVSEDNLADTVSDRDVTEPPDETNHSVSEDKNDKAELEEKNVEEKEIKNEITTEMTQDGETSKPEKVEINVAEMATEEPQIESLEKSHDLPQSDEINEKIEEKSNVEAVELDKKEVVSPNLEADEKVDNAGDQSVENNHEDIEIVGEPIDSNEKSKENDAIKECTEAFPNSSQTVTDNVTETKEQLPVSMVAHTVNSDETSSQKLVIGVTEDDKIENCTASVTSTENSTTIISVTTTTTSTTTSKLLESEPKSEVTVTNDSSEAKFVTCIDIKSQECEKIKKAAPVPPARTKKVESTPVTEQKEPAVAAAGAADVPKTPILHQQTVQPEATGLLAYIRNFFSCMTSKK